MRVSVSLDRCRREGGAEYIRALQYHPKRVLIGAHELPANHVHFGIVLRASAGVNRQPLLQEFQTVQRKRLRAAVGAVVAANRLQKVLAAGRKESLEKAAISHGGQLPEEKAVGTAVLLQDEAGLTAQDEEKI